MNDNQLIKTKNIITCSKEENKNINTSSENNLLICNIKKFIDENYASNSLTLKYISDKFHINSCHLSSTFKKVTSETLIEYITKKRINEAKKLLLNTDLKISDISEKVGYLDCYYFSRLFKKYVGISPLKFKQLNYNTH